MEDHSRWDAALLAMKELCKKREIQLIAHHDEKVYDGTDYSALPPIIVGTLAEDHAAMVTQRFKSKNAGETALVPEIRIFNKRGEPIEYVIMIQSATGKIRPRPIKVWAETDTKEYDGTILSAVVPEIDNAICGDAIVATQSYEDAEVGTDKTLKPTVSINDDNDGKNYEVILKPVDTGTILPAVLETQPQTRQMIADQLGTDDFIILQEGELTCFSGEVCYCDDKKVYLKVEARKRVQLVVEMQRIHDELHDIEVGEKLQVMIKGKETKISRLNHKSSLPGIGGAAHR